MVSATERHTIDQLRKDPPRGRWELIEGRLQMMTPAGYGHGKIVGRIFRLLSEHVEAHALGVVLTGEPGFIIGRDPDTLRAPDVAFVRAERDEPELRGFFPGAPDLAVEVVSPEDRQQDVESKADQWLEAGSAAVWVIWPATRSVTVHRRAGERPEILHEGDTLAGESLIPGFACPIDKLFDT